MKSNFIVALLVLPIFFLTNCSDDDNTIPVPQEVSKTYQLMSVADPAISGTAKFIKNDDDSITVELQLTGTPAGGEHPAHIHSNTAAEGGGIAVTLGAVNGDTGFSTVTFNQLDDATDITYEELLNFNGYINVHLSSTELATLVSQGDIGQNELTGASVIYTLDELNVSGVSGTATFSERASGKTLVSIRINGTAAGTNHINHIHDGDVDTPGAVAVTLTNVDGGSGIALTSVNNKDDATAISYLELTQYNGYINIHASETDLIVVAQGNIGQNAQN